MYVGIILGLIAGVAVSIQGAFNATIGRAIGFYETSMVISVLASIIGGVFVLIGVGQGNLMMIKEIPWYHPVIAAICGFTVVTGIAAAIANSNLALGLGAVLAGQMVMAIILDQIGFLGAPKVPFTWGRLVGVLLLIAGMIVIFYSSEPAS